MAARPRLPRSSYPGRSAFEPRSKIAPEPTRQEPSDCWREFQVSVSRQRSRSITSTWRSPGASTGASGGMRYGPGSFSSGMSNEMVTPGLGARRRGVRDADRVAVPGATAVVGLQAGAAAYAADPGGGSCVDRQGVDPGVPDVVGREAGTRRSMGRSGRCRERSSVAGRSGSGEPGGAQSDRAGQPGHEHGTAQSPAPTRPLTASFRIATPYRRPTHDLRSRTASVLSRICAT